jgi:ribonuclease HII
VRDSKKLSAQQRETLYGYIAEHGALKHSFAFVEAATIDAIGIVNAANEAASRSLALLGVGSSRAKVLLDAGLRAPAQWEQEAFVRGDERIPAIAFASIVAKVTRDRHMQELSEQYSVYRFDEHKGYGTLAHRRAIRSTGLSVLHRVTFCTNLRIRPKSV